MELKLLFLGIKSHIAGVLSVVRREYEERRGGARGLGPLTVQIIHLFA